MLQKEPASGKGWSVSVGDGGLRTTHLLKQVGRPSRPQKQTLQDQTSWARELTRTLPREKARKSPVSCLPSPQRLCTIQGGETVKRVVHSYEANECVCRSGRKKNHNWKSNHIFSRVYIMMRLKLRQTCFQLTKREKMSPVLYLHASSHL